MGPNTALRNPRAARPLRIHLNLAELVELNVVEQHRASGLLKAGSGFARDPQRPKRILGIVQHLFKGLPEVQLTLGAGQNAGRYLKARFAWQHSAEYGGVAADGLSRSKIGKFVLADPKQDQGVTAYVFEGVIGNWVVEHFGRRSIDVSNIFAAFVAHELGHNLGLEHAYSPGDIMFIYQDQPRDAKKHWLTRAANRGLRFKGWQVERMRQVVSQP